LDEFMGLVERVLVEAVINFSDGDIKLAARVLKISVNSLEKKIIRDFGSKDLIDFHVLLRRMRDKKKAFEIE
jgi:DNA-binding NtrC family response regulator